MRNHFNGKTIESAVCSDLGDQSKGDLPCYIELRFTDGSAVRITDQSLHIIDVPVDPYDLAHGHSKGHPR